MTACVVLLTDRESKFKMASTREIEAAIREIIGLGKHQITEVYYSTDELYAKKATPPIGWDFTFYGMHFKARAFSADWASGRKASAYMRDRHMIRCAIRNYGKDNVFVVAITGSENLQESQRCAEMIESAGNRGLYTHHFSITDTWKKEF